MQTVLWQAKKSEDTHWLNVPDRMVGNLLERGYQARALVSLEDAMRAIVEARESAIA